MTGVLDSAIIPTIVLGSARNGTTWLGNLLASHPEIAGVAHRCHWGQVESDILSKREFAGDFTDDQKFIQFMEAYSISDYFCLSNGNKQFFYDNRPESFYDFYLELMDRHARSQNVNRWTTKLEPRFYHHEKELDRFLGMLQTRYANVKFISIQRDFPPVIKSYLNMEGPESKHSLRGLKRLSAIVLHSARYSYHYQKIQKLAASHDCLRLTFDELSKRTEETTNRVCDFLGISCPEGVSTSPFPKNSSFASLRPAEAIPTWIIWTSDKIVKRFFDLMPFLARQLLRYRDRQRGLPCPYTWRLFRLQFMPESFAQELKRTGQTALFEILFDQQPESNIPDPKQ